MKRKSLKIEQRFRFSYNHAHVVFQASDRYLCVKQVDRKPFINC